MKSSTFLVLSFIFGLLQGPFLPPVFAEGILVVVFVLYNPPRRFLPALFLLGFIFDIFQSQTLGVSSILFLAFGSLVFLLKNDLPLKSPVLAGVLVILINILRAKIVFGILSFPSAIIAGIIAVLALNFFIGSFNGKALGTR